MNNVAIRNTDGRVMLDKIQHGLFNVISKVTGHNIGDLSPDLYLEADLGIDSLKQIEVMQHVSGLIPEGVRHKFIEDGFPDNLLQASTIEELAYHIYELLNNVPAIKKVTKNNENKYDSLTDMKQPVVNNTSSIVLDVLADITGYDVSEIDLDMMLDRDMGIDSLKQMTLINRLVESLAGDEKVVFQEAIINKTLTSVATVSELIKAINEISGASSSINSAQNKVTEDNANSVISSKKYCGNVPILDAQYQHIIAHFAMDSTSLCSHVRLEGTINIEKLHFAWLQVIQRQPALRLKITNINNAKMLGNLRIEVEEHSNMPEIEVINLSSDTKLDIEAYSTEITNKLLMRSWDIEQWPLHDLKLYKVGRNRYHLYLSIHHLIADGISIQQFFRELLAFYDSEINDKIALVTPAVSMKEYRELVTEINKADKRTDSDNLKKFLTHQGKEQFKWHPSGKWTKSNQLKMCNKTFTLTQEDTSKIKVQVKRMRVSLNSLLVTTLLRIVSKKSTSNKIIINIPTSGRIYDDVEALNTMGDFAQNITCAFESPAKNQSWGELARKVHFNIQDAIANNIDRLQIKQVAEFAENIALENGDIPLFQKQLLINTVKSNLYLSFVGQSGLNSRYGNISVTSYHPATVTVRGGMDNLVELFNDQLVWSCNYDGNVITDEEIELFKKNVLASLQELANQSCIDNSASLTEIDETNKNTGLWKATLEGVKSYTRELLGREILPTEINVDIEAELGLDSLEHVRLISRLRRQRKDINASDLLKCRTLQEIASKLVEKKHTEDKYYSNCKHDTTIDQHWNTVYEAVISECKNRGNAVAIKDHLTKLTYSELDSRSNQLANTLFSLGVRRNDLVAIMMDRSPEMIIGILAILKAGGAYLPLDPNYPQDRLGYMLNHSGVKLLITQTNQQSIALNIVQESSVKHVVFLDKELEGAVDSDLNFIGPQTIKLYTKDNLSIVNTSQDLMTVLYTSGSTGKPKGVMLAHGGYVNRIEWMRQALDVRESDRIAFKTSCCFDISVWEIFLPLISGATMYPIEKSVVSDPWALAEWMNDERITVMHFVPSLFGEFLSVVENEDYQFTDLRWLVFSGEALPVGFIRRWMKKYGNRVKLINLYGPTEASIDVTEYVIHSLPAPDAKRIPIGKPLPNTTLIILDKNMCKCSIGHIGDLYIAGIQLAKGYLNDKEKTADAFIDNPFDDVDGDKLYRTGDLALWLDDGNIDYRGRKDSQIKIRGYRVELGEIESVLQSYRNVAEAVVITKEKEDGSKRIVALVRSNDTDFNLSKLKEFVKSKLPHYMVPATLKLVEIIPRNQNGKTDRNAIKQQIETSSELSIISDTKESDMSFPLGPAQKWLRQHYGESCNWAGVHRFRYRSALDTEVFDNAVASVVQRHPALSTVFVEENGVLKQRYVKDVAASGVSYFDGSHLTVKKLNTEINTLVTTLYNELRIDQSPLWRIVCVKDTEESYQIIIIGHHMICDMVSSAIMFSELWSAYTALLVDENATLGDPPQTYFDYIKALHKEDESGRVDSHIEYWKNKFPSAHSRLHVPLDFSLGQNTEASAAMVGVELDLDTTRQLNSVARKSYGVSLYPVLLAPLYRLLSAWTRSGWVVISHRGHGRSLGGGTNYIDAIGDFAVNYPVAIELAENEVYAKTIESIQVALDEVPMNGVSYDFLGDRLPDHLYPDNKLTSIRSNYLGDRTVKKSKLFEFDSENYDKRLSNDENERTTLIECFFSIVNGTMRLDISYSKNFHKKESIEWMALLWKNNILALIEESETVTESLVGSTHMLNPFIAVKSTYAAEGLAHV